MKSKKSALDFVDTVRFFEIYFDFFRFFIFTWIILIFMNILDNSGVFGFFLEFLDFFGRLLFFSFFLIFFDFLHKTAVS